MELEVQDKSVDMVSFENPIDPDPSLVLVTTNYPTSSSPSLFIHNCQIKSTIATLILDNNSEKNMGSCELVQHLQLPNTLHPHPYQLGCLQQGGPCIQVSTQCAITFVIVPFHDVVTCDVAPLDCAELLLGISYQQDHHTVYHAKTH